MQRAKPPKKKAVGNRKKERLPFKRKVLSPGSRARLMTVLKKRLAMPRFWNKLPGFRRVRKYEFEGIPVAIKRIHSIYPEEHGYDFERLRRVFLNHQKAVRSGLIKADGYSLRSAKVYGRINVGEEKYLAMEYIEAKPLREMETFNNPGLGGSLQKAYEELYRNFGQLLSKKMVEQVPQLSDFMAQNTNPKNPEKGRWVFFLPYDFF